jgi:hypothetical protein
MLGMDVEEVRAEVMRAAAKSGRRPAVGRPAIADATSVAEPQDRPALPLLPSPNDRIAHHRTPDCEAADPKPESVPDAWDGLTTATSPIRRTPKCSLP